MFGSKNDREKNIDRLIGPLVKAYSDRNHAEPETSSPFLPQRILARIEEEKRRRGEEGSAWVILFREGLQVIPVLTLLTIFIMGLAISTRFSDQPVHHNTVASTPQALTAGDIAPFSNDEMLAAAIGTDDRATK